MNFDNKVPIAVIVTVILQAIGLIWWVSQQAFTVDNLKEEVGGLSSKMAIEQNVNLRRDVAEHDRKIKAIMEELREHGTMGNMMAKMMQKSAVMQKDVERNQELIDELWDELEDHQDSHKANRNDGR